MEQLTKWGDTPDTAYLDAQLAFQIWKSPLHGWEFEQAVLTKALPQTVWQVMFAEEDPDVGIRKFTLYWDMASRDFLRRVGGEGVDREPWWPHAVSVMAFWLRYISRRVKKWQQVEEEVFRMELGPGYEEWEAMGKHLARLVIKAARAFQEGNIRALRALVPEDKREKGRAPWLPWKPAEVLRALGLET